jgi:hypothetical protein
MAAVARSSPSFSSQLPGLFLPADIFSSAHWSEEAVVPILKRRNKQERFGDWFSLHCLGRRSCYLVGGHLCSAITVLVVKQHCRQMVLFFC